MNTSFTLTMNFYAYLRTSAVIIRSWMYSACSIVDLCWYFHLSKSSLLGFFFNHFSKTDTLKGNQRLIWPNVTCDLGYIFASVFLIWVSLLMARNFIGLLRLIRPLSPLPLNGLCSLSFEMCVRAGGFVFIPSQGFDIGVGAHPGSSDRLRK